MKLILQPNEMIIMAGNSQLCQPETQVQGKLIVTNQRIYFRTLKEEFRICDREITPDEISDLIFFNTRWLLPFGMNIITKNGAEHQFLVRNRNEWAKLITKMY
ncbi:MAG TPA: hypothetical protein VJ203_10365 [Bacteroidales bacterium]|nr:hypothetical protein [Bacteroidales bacterium]